MATNTQKALLKKPKIKGLLEISGLRLRGIAGPCKLEHILNGKTRGAEASSQKEDTVSRERGARLGEAVARVLSTDRT